MLIFCFCEVQYDWQIVAVVELVVVVSVVVVDGEIGVVRAMPIVVID